VSIAAEHPRRRRRTPERARQEIIDAAWALLARVPSQDVTVSAIMAGTTLSRKSFYVYFRDRAALLTELLAPLRAETDAAVRRWYDAPDLTGAGRAALRHAAELYRQHGVVLRALAAASEHDAEAAEVWRSVLEPVIEAGAHTIARATEAGMSGGLEPRATAEALVTMNVHYLLDRMPGASASEVDAAVEVLATIWERTIFTTVASVPRDERHGFT
jgi:AcrR family transcriptional regulator